MSAHDEEGYAGPAEVVVDGSALTVAVTLRGGFQPIDGRYHWYGRIEHSDVLDAAVSGGAAVTVRTPHGDAEARLSDVDAWGRYRVAGTGRPPFATG